MEKIKIISGNNYTEIENEVNAFIEGRIIRDLKVIEMYDISSDSGFCTYHIFYFEPKAQ